MIATALLIVFMGFYMFYFTSQRAMVTVPFGLKHWVKAHEKWSKTMSLTLFIMAYILLWVSYGFASGTLFLFIILMALGSLIIILNPIRMLKLNHIIAFYVLMLIFDIFLY